MCGKNHYGDRFMGTKNSFSCCKSGHKMRDCPNMNSQDKGTGQAQESDPSDGTKKNNFDVLLCRGKQDTSPDVVIGMFKVRLIPTL